MLREGGAVAFSVFAAPEQNPWVVIPSRLLVDMSGEPPSDPTAPGILSMGDPARTRSLIGAAGLEARRMEDVPMTWRFDDFDGYWVFLNDLAGALSARIEAMSGEQRDDFRAQLEEAVEPYRGERGLELPGLTQNTLAVAAR